MNEDLQRITGTVVKARYSSESFSAGVLALDPDCQTPVNWVQFAGPIYAQEGDELKLLGRFEEHPKFGTQFRIAQLDYQLPDDPEALAAWLHRSNAFPGLGPAKARQLVRLAGNTRDGLGELLAKGSTERITQALGVQPSQVGAWRAAWKEQSATLALSQYLAGFGLTGGQINQLVTTSDSMDLLHLLRHNPWKLTDLVDGYGYKRADEIALKMGHPEDADGRIEAAIVHVLKDEARQGHTWQHATNLVSQTVDLTGQPAKLVRERASACLDSGQIMAEGDAVALPEHHAAELAIYKAMREGVEPREVPGATDDTADLNDRQANAYRQAMALPISILSGGAGTGKTYTVARIAKAFDKAGLTIALCAPTGKAAKRIEQSMAKAGVSLSACTIHRLLHSDGKGFQRPSLSEPYRKGNTDYKPLDAVIVDEASMVDAHLARALIQRIDLNRTRLLLVGDHNQLPPVGPGNVLRDLIHHRVCAVTTLTEVVRQAGVLEHNATVILEGTVAPSADEPAWTVLTKDEPAEVQRLLYKLVLDRIPEGLGLDRIRDVQVLTPTHEGLLGGKTLNAELQRRIHELADEPRKWKFEPGDKVIQTKNDYQLGVMNGHQGIVTKVQDESITIDWEDTGELVMSRPDAKHVQLAYAMTAHKAQGSEYPCVVVVAHCGMADRNWLYTAATRASKYLLILGTRRGIEQMARRQRSAERRTWLSRWGKAGHGPQEATPEPQPPAKPEALEPAEAEQPPELAEYQGVDPYETSLPDPEGPRDTVKQCLVLSYAMRKRLTLLRGQSVQLPERLRLALAEELSQQIELLNQFPVAGP